MPFGIPRGTGARRAHPTWSNVRGARASSRRASNMKITLGTVAVVLVASCGGEAGKPASPAPVSLEQMPAQLRKAMCDRIYSCCSPAERMGNDEIGEDAASCQGKLNAETTF